MSRIFICCFCLVLLAALTARGQEYSPSVVLGGRVTGSEGGIPIFPGTVKAFRVTGQGAFPEMDSCVLTEEGDYRFTDLDTGRYTFRVLPGDQPECVGIPTYLGDEFSWDKARFIDVDTVSTDTLLDILLIEQCPTGPNDRAGSMSGNVSYSDSVGQKGSLAKPVTRTSVILIRKASSKSADDIHQGGDFSGYVETDDQGRYSFSGIAEGDYGLVVDIPGMLMFNSYDVRIDSGSVVTGLDFVVGQIGINTADRVDVRSIQAEVCKLFPNPGNGWIHMVISGEAPNSIRVYDPAGRLVASPAMPGGGPFLLNITGLERGMYLIILQGRSSSRTLKYLKIQ